MVNDFPSPLGKDASRDEPRLGEAHFNVGTEVGRVAELAEYFLYRARLVGAGKLVFCFEFFASLCAVFCRESEAETLLRFFKQEAGRDASLCCMAAHQVFPTFVETPP